MRSLSYLTVLLILISELYAQSPHGENFSIECSICHSDNSWNKLIEPIKFDHSQTKFRLLGQHRRLECKSCHQSLEFNLIQTDCASCHQDVHQNSVSKDCLVCHDFNSWIVKDIIKLHQSSRFPLVGKHKSADCSDCHRDYDNRIFRPNGIECFDCHKNDFNNSQNPNHVIAGFDKDCLMCHSINQQSWNKSNFNHDFFSLVGGHKIGNCFACHTQSNFKGLTKDCYSCHKSDYENVLSPNHVSGNFSKECSDCHNINGWVPASFNHNLTQFPLTGRHVNLSCQLCHSGGYSGTSSECYSCHKNDYENGQNNPNHVVANFPTECRVCHSTNGWTPSNFQHDAQYFPIYSGKHRNKWSNCSDCHRVPTSFASFSCIDCHEHRKSRMDDEHSDVNGYVYVSNACLSCHPKGDSDKPINFNRLQTR
ncbi:MAG TPA: hypothetical protein PK559_03540 [Ignavibacteriaceae bacterium]|nr:hypothetical protein [Ignavibacteriaceae bacterium]